MGTFIVGVAVLGIVGLIVRSMVRDKKKGKSIHCGNSCSSCGGHCGH
ncbi:FeoB-associated Cys-rich membrane protein [Anaerostipes sp.]|nr:FeoB-associated Cys-rich membrane protein [Anaerostipes sp.]MBS7007511.1 FeoB-associated Cys-rich membrane protein [Anaerostipes sp.]